MATQKYEFTGKVKWAQVLKPNKFDKYSLQFYPDDETRKAIKDTGIKNKLGEDEDGFFYTFRRNPEDKFGGGPVVVKGNNGKLIGNGSVCKIELEVYDYKNDFGEGKGSRLNVVEVLELVEFNPDGTNLSGNVGNTVPRLPTSTVPEPKVGKKTGARAF